MIKIIKEILVITTWIGISVFFGLWLNNNVIVNAQVVSASMEGTIMTHSRVLGLRMFGQIQRGDIVVFEKCGFDGVLIKRVIALPGETIEIIDGITFINEIALHEEYKKEPTNTGFDPIVVCDGKFFVMGDNRNNSYDSRAFGLVCITMILGRIHIY